MLNFNFYSPTQFVFGKGEEANIGTLLAARGAKKVLLHYGGQKNPACSAVYVFLCSRHPCRL